jgi:ISXO2-like transposase domain
MSQDRTIARADETYIGKKHNNGWKRRGGFANKNTVFALVERDGKVKSTHITAKNFAGVKRALKKHLDTSASLMTDEHRKFRNIGKKYASHEVVNHSQGICPRQRIDQHYRRRVLDLQARHDWHLPALQLEAPASVLGRGRFSL